MSGEETTWLILADCHHLCGVTELDFEGSEDEKMLAFMFFFLDVSCLCVCIYNLYIYNQCVMSG